MSRAIPPAPGWRSLIRELPVLGAAVLAYWGGRGLTEGSYADAVANAGHLIDLERRLGIYHEIWLQERIIDHHWLVTLMNWVYMWGHWPVIAVCATWLFFRRPPTYFLLRNAFLISGAIGLLVFIAFPVAPPRLAGIEVADTVTLHSNSYRVLQPPGFVNQYAALPSLHFGWNLLIGGGMAREAPLLPVRIASALLPVAMAVAVVLTANHYIVDVFVGAAVALFGLLVAWKMRSFLLRSSSTRLRLLRRWNGLPEFP